MPDVGIRNIPLAICIRISIGFLLIFFFSPANASLDEAKISEKEIHQSRCKDPPQGLDQRMEVVGRVMFHFRQRLDNTLFLNTLQNTKSDQSSNPLYCDDTSRSYEWQITDLDRWEDTKKCQKYSPHPSGISPHIQ